MCLCILFVYFFFFFKQKTAYEMRISDWSSDVCSSDLGLVQPQAGAVDRFEPERLDDGRLHHDSGNAEVTPLLARAFALAPRIGLLPRSGHQRVRRRLAVVATQRKRTLPPRPAPDVHVP